MFLIGIEKLSFLVHASLLLIASSGECCARCNFVLPVMLGGTCVYLIGYGKTNIGTNSCKTVSTKTTSLTWRH